MRPSTSFAASQPAWQQVRTTALGLLLGVTVFLGLERIVEPRYNFTIGLDEDIPFIAGTWFIYVSFFPFVILLAAYAERRAFAQFASAVKIAFFSSIPCYLLLPEILPRPESVTIDNAFLRHRLERMWQVDLAVNGLPSLHVCITLLACWFLASQQLRKMAWGLGLLICASTLTLKQHSLIDVAGGGILVPLCAYWVNVRSTEA